MNPYVNEEWHLVIPTQVYWEETWMALKELKYKINTETWLFEEVWEKRYCIFIMNM